MRIASLHLYPVKGLRGIDVRAADVDPLGFVGDRRFLITDPSGKFQSQRTLPAMATIATELTNDTLTLRAPGRADLHVSRLPDPTAPTRIVEVWSSQGLVAEDCGRAAADWLSDLLQSPVHLVRIGASFHRPVKPAKAQPGDIVTFADGYPFLVVNNGTLAALNDRLIAAGEAPVPIDRFRANLVVDGAPADAEDTWSRFRVGNVIFRAAGDCVRCPVTTTDQSTGERGHEPLRTLSTYRRARTDGRGVIFGQNLIHETKSGTVRVGDAVELL